MRWLKVPDNEINEAKATFKQLQEAMKKIGDALSEEHLLAATTFFNQIELIKDMDASGIMLYNSAVVPKFQINLLSTNLVQFSALLTQTLASKKLNSESNGSVSKLITSLREFLASVYGNYKDALDPAKKPRSHSDADVDPYVEPDSAFVDPLYDSDVNPAPDAKPNLPQKTAPWKYGLAALVVLAGLTLAATGIGAIFGFALIGIGMSLGTGIGIAVGGLALTSISAYGIRRALKLDDRAEAQAAAIDEPEFQSVLHKRMLHRRPSQITIIALPPTAQHTRDRSNDASSSPNTAKTTIRRRPLSLSAIAHARHRSTRSQPGTPHTPYISPDPTSRPSI